VIGWPDKIQKHADHPGISRGLREGEMRIYGTAKGGEQEETPERRVKRLEGCAGMTPEGGGIGSRMPARNPKDGV